MLTADHQHEGSFNRSIFLKRSMDSPWVFSHSFGKLTSKCIWSILPIDFFRVFSNISIRDKFNPFVSPKISSNREKTFSAFHAFDQLISLNVRHAQSSDSFNRSLTHFPTIRGVSLCFDSEFQFQ